MLTMTVSYMLVIAHGKEISMAKSVYYDHHQG